MPGYENITFMEKKTMYTTENQHQTNAKVRLCGLWKNQVDKTTYLSGGLCGGIRFVVVKDINRHAQSNQPEYLAYSVPSKLMEDVQENGIPWESLKGHRITGLWLKEGKTQKYFAGDWEPDTSLFIFRNGNKQEGSNQPDYEVFLVTRPRRDRFPTTIPDDDFDINSVEESFGDVEAAVEPEVEAKESNSSAYSDGFGDINFD